MGRKNRLSYKKNMKRKKRAKKRQCAMLRTSGQEVASAHTLQSLQSSLELPNSMWSDQSPQNLEKLVLCKIS